MNKVAHYLQEHLIGEVMTGSDARKYFSTDSSIFSITPAIILYPKNENDVRKAARFTWQLAERGRIIPMTARGSGTSQTGASLGSGIVLVFPAHMNRILELDGKSGDVVIEPGINYGKLQQSLNTHNRFLPPFPATFEYSTVGGAIATNAAGEKSIKYGSTRGYVKGLRVVLANGEIIETRRISKRDLSKKLGLATMEGEIYRSLDTLIEENQDLIKRTNFATTKNSAGYALDMVKRKDGSFDLTSLLVGSEGTLGIITEATMETAVHNPNNTLIAALVGDLQVAAQIVQEIRGFSELPSAVEMVDEHLLSFVQQHNPNILMGIIESPLPKVVLLIELDNTSDRIQKRLAKKVQKLLGRYQVAYRIETDSQKKDELWKIRRSASSVIAHTEGMARALPIIEDGIVPVEKLDQYMSGIYDLFERHGLRAAVWGHAGDANLRMQPFLDLAQVGDRQKAFKLMDEYYKMVIDMGGSISAAHGDGRLRGAYLSQLYGNEMYQLFEKVKQIFDPYGILNPGVKIGVSLDDIKPLLRQEYSLEHLYDHLPRS